LAFIFTKLQNRHRTAFGVCQILVCSTIIGATCSTAFAQSYNVTGTLSTTGSSGTASSQLNQITGGGNPRGQYGNTGNYDYGAVAGGTNAAPTITSGTGGSYIAIPEYNPIATGNHGLALGTITITFQGGLSTAFIPTPQNFVNGTGGGWSFRSTSFGTTALTVSDGMQIQLFAPSTTAGAAATTKIGGTSTITGTSPSINSARNTITGANQVAADWPTAFTQVTVTLTNTLDDLSPFEKSGATATTTYFDVAALASDTITGLTGTDVSSYFSNATINITATSFVPEPGTWSLMAGCAAACGLSLRRRRLRGRRLAA
jgi:hypothetical protein